MRIFLDTNFLIYAADKKIDYFEEIDEIISEKHELVIPETVLGELKKLRQGNSKTAAFANLALKILEKNKDKIKILKTDKLPDDFIRENIKPRDMLASMDRELNKKIKRKITIRENKKIKIN